MEPEIILGNTKSFDILVIEPNVIKDREWTDPEYLKKLSNDSFCRYITVEPEKFVEVMGRELLVEKYTEPYVKIQVISEEENYIMEIMYIENISGHINEFGMLLNRNDDKIAGNVLVTRTYVSSTDNTMYFDNITPEKVEDMLYCRANTKIITFDSDEEKYNEFSLFGPLDIFSDNFFGENRFNIKKLELAFLKHNLNIWYTEDKYGNLDVAGNILPDTTRVDKMIVFSMWSDEYRDSLTLEEFNKIIYLSKKLDNYLVSEDYMKIEKDELGREIIKNKYKILNQFYKKYKT
jgi:hypothetical protein